MVEIKRSHVGKSSAVENESFDHRLLYSKSKVYVNPTPYSRDNIPGFVALVKKVCIMRFMGKCANSDILYFDKEGKQPSYLLAWIPENLLNEKGPAEWDKFIKMEERTVQDDDEGANQYHL